LGNDCRQEDIKFVTCPELIAAQFFAEPLEDNEALIITGAKPYSTYKGFDKSFEFTGEADPNAPCSDVVIAIDATDFSRLAKGDQYTQQYIMREIVKAYAGFVKCPTSKIATGNWGCGAFQV
jgi:poly(ADP-ribose) glycohydrolase